MNAQTKLARTASQTDPTTGVDPYNTAERIYARQHEALDFLDWVKSIPTLQGVENAEPQK